MRMGGSFLHSADFEGFPEGVEIGEHIRVEAAVGILIIELAEIAELGIEDFHGLLPHFVDIIGVGIDEGVGRGIADILGIGDCRLGREHVVDEDFGKLFILAAVRDAHGVNEVVGALIGRAHV